MKYTKKRAGKRKLRPLVSGNIIVVFSLFFILIALPFIVFFAQRPQQTQQNAATLGTNPLDVLLKQTIDSINQYGWNPAVQGYWINWYRDNPTTQQNTGHDGQNELRMMQAMTGYKFLHPGDTTLDANIQRVLPTFTAEWQNSTLDKGWVYFTFLRLRQYTGNTATWDTTMQHWAQSVYQAIPADTGVPHGVIADSTAANAPTCPDGFRVDQTFEDGLALIDAGKRYNHPEWTQAGTREVQIVQQQAFNTKYHLFARIICQGSVWNDEARDGELGQEAEALLYTGSYTNNQQFLTLAQQLLDSIANPTTGFIDQTNGGLFFKLTLSTGVVDTSKKVTQQFHILMAVHMANQLMNNRYAALEANMVQALQKTSFPPPVAGWMYEVAPNFTLYKGTENWISTEASGIAMQAILAILEGNSPLLQSGAITTITPASTANPTNSPTPMSTAIPTMTPTPTQPIIIPTLYCIGACPTPILSPVPSSIPSITLQPSIPISTTPPNNNKSLISFLFQLIQLLLKFFSSLFQGSK